MLKNFNENIRNNIKNIPGWRIRRKIVTIECDDWGEIRMPSKEVYENLSGKGLNVKGWFNSYDTIETQQDLEKLLDVLASLRDKNNNSAIMTPVTNVANPDFDKIRECGFLEYHYEPFTVTLKRYYPYTNVSRLWQQGISAGIFIPELHGREHIIVQLWLQKLRERNRELLSAFDNGFIFLDIQSVNGPDREFGTEFYFTSDDQKAFLVDSIKEGITLFSRIFGYSPRVFVPGNGIFHPEFTWTLGENGIKFMNVNHHMAYTVEGGDLKHKCFITGQKDPCEITYYTRNCVFEPSSYDYQGINLTLRQIEAAFWWRKPANISTPRVNFAGGIEPINRERGLDELGKLLKTITQRWPDAEFMSSGNALTYMQNTN